ncbi:hypothetical protein BKA57DRAFT_469395, partial [Linnemannia elongata]
MLYGLLFLYLFPLLSFLLHVTKSFFAVTFRVAIVETVNLCHAPLLCTCLWCGGMKC